MGDSEGASPPYIYASGCGCASELAFQARAYQAKTRGYEAKKLFHKSGFSMCIFRPKSISVMSCHPIDLDTMGLETGASKLRRGRGAKL